MSLFILSLLIGLVLYEVVSIIQPELGSPTEPGSHTYKIGSWAKLELPERSYLILKLAAFLLAILLFISIATIIVAKQQHPPEGYAYRFADALTSPRMAAAVFGGLVGILLGNLLNRLIRNPANYKFQSFDRLEIVLIFALVILGIGGEEFLRSSAQRINKISVGTTTEISFANSPPASNRGAAEQPNGAFRNTAGASGGSAGLAKLYDIGSRTDSNIDRDKQFIEILARYERVPQPTFENIGTLAEDILSPIGSCLAGIFQFNGDATFVEQELSQLSVPLRELAVSQTTSENIKDELKRRVDSVILYARPRLNDLNKFSDKERYSCREITSIRIDDVFKDVGSIDLFRDAGKRERLPYAAIAYASVMVALRHYEAAVIMMDSWINAKAGKANPTVADRWYLLRARSAQSLFLEEWIRERGAVASSALRQYHIDNLKAIASGMQAFRAISELSQKNSDYKWSTGVLGASQSGDEGLCNFPIIPKPPAEPGKPPTSEETERLPTAEEKERLETIYNTYLSARKDYVDQALKHPIMKIRFASVIGSEIRDLLALDLKCIRVSARQSTRAEHIERYVRSEINLMQNLSSLKSTDDVRARIRDAQQMLTLAFQLIDREASNAKDGKGKDNVPLQARIETEPILELYETLLATQSQLRDFSEREVTP